MGGLAGCVIIILYIILITIHTDLVEIVSSAGASSLFSDAAKSALDHD